MREFINIVENAEVWDRPYLFHVSPKSNLFSIQQNGLDPRFSRGTDAIYLASDQDHALGYDNHHDQDGASVLLRVEIAKLDTSKLLPDDADLPDCLNDPEEWSDYSWVGSLRICGQCRYEGVVPPDAITVVA